MSDLAQKIEEDIKKNKTFKSIFEKILKSESNLFSERNKKINTLNLTEENDSKILKEINSDFIKEITDIEKDRNSLLINKLEEKIIPSINLYTDKINKLKKNVSQLNDLKKKGILSSETENPVKKELLQYENDRILNDKAIFLHFIHSELYYHSKAVEKLSNLYTKIHNKYPILDLVNFNNTYKLGFSNKDLKQFGYDKKYEKKMENNNEIKNSINNHSHSNNISNQGMINNLEENSNNSRKKRKGRRNDVENDQSDSENGDELVF
jgi:hypothetical protein